MFVPGGLALAPFKALGPLPVRDRALARSHAEITIRSALSSHQGWFRTIRQMGPK
jgi:hypothetical protein